MEGLFLEHDNLGNEGNAALGEQVAWQSAGGIGNDDGHKISPE
jgi:hypothetical protein